MYIITVRLDGKWYYLGGNVLHVEAKRATRHISKSQAEKTKKEKSAMLQRAGAVLIEILRVE